MSRIVLHNYFRSSTSVRVRIALGLKGLDYEYVSYALRKGEHRQPAYLSHNPAGLVPALEIDGLTLSQSLAILEYLEEVYPEPPLLPVDHGARARVRALAMMVACDIHPVNNLRILQALETRFGAGADAVADWFRTWVAASFEPMEQMLASDDATGTYCHGESVTLADICLAGQVLNNARFAVDMAPYPTIARIHEACMAQVAFQRAAPAAQPDSE